MRCFLGGLKGSTDIKDNARDYRAAACRISDLRQREKAQFQGHCKALIALDVGFTEIERPDEIMLCHVPHESVERL